MREKDIENKIANNYRVLAAIHLYPESFLASLGSEKALKEYIDKVLDSINANEQELKQLKNDKD